jgi:DNA-nicking Smr family endonuclease
MSRRRALSADELALWRKVAVTVKALPNKALALDSPPLLPPAPAKEKTPAPLPKTSPDAGVAPVRAPTPSVELNQDVSRRIKRGRLGVDGRLDLHGHTQDHALAALHRFIDHHRARGSRLVLVITGKGRPEDGAHNGILRRLVPLWLRSPGFGDSVIAVGEALPKHGGAGALYVHLRRVRE